MIPAILASEIIATREMRGGCNVLSYASSGLMNSVFTISFSLKVEICTMKVFLLKMSFVGWKQLFHDRPPMLL